METKIQIRAMRASDWRALYEIWTDRRICWGTRQVPFQSEDEIEKKVTNPPDGMYGLVAEVDGRVVGHINLHRSRSPRAQHTAGFGMAAHPDHWGQGVGSALMAAIVDLADNWLNLKRVELEVYTDNAAAIRLYEKFGFVLEGTKRKYAFREGEYVDAHVMARVKD